MTSSSESTPGQANPQLLAPLFAQPFDLADNDAYAAWRAWKLEHRARSAEDLRVSIDDPYQLDAAELAALTERCRHNNMAIYALTGAESEKSLVHSLGQQLGLTRLDSNLRADEDSVTSLEVRAQQGNQYIPYTNRRLSWHSDGYYNTPAQQIRGIIMHCVRPAASGGENALIDHEWLYIRLRDENPALVEALMQPEAMTIPANIEAGEEIRAAQTGPVFSVDASSGRLHMRYSARQRNIDWQTDVTTQEAAAMIGELLDDDGLVIRHRLGAGEGILCNNVLHNRTGFEDSPAQQRLMYRARYYDRIAGTEMYATN